MIITDPPLSISDDVNDQVREVSSLLKKRIAGAGETQKGVERKLGWGDGYISQILRGAVDLKFKHFFAIASVIGMEPADFFRELYRFEEGAARPAAAPAVDKVGFDREVLRSEIEAIVIECLDRRQAGIL